MYKQINTNTHTLARSFARTQTHINFDTYTRTYSDFEKLKKTPLKRY